MPTIQFCSDCGSQIDTNTRFCPSCGKNRNPSTSIATNQTTNRVISEKSGLTAFLLCLFLGSLGIHRFYVGKIGTGILMLLTSGGFGIWYLYDLITIVCNNFTDKNDHVVEITRDPSPAKTVLMVIGSIVFAFLLFFITIITIVFLFVSGLADVAQDQLNALRMKDYEKAYSYTSTEFKKSVSIDNFKQFIEANPVLINNISASFPEREFNNNLGTIKGTLKLKDGSYLPLEIQLIKENNTWKIIYIDLKPIHSDTELNETQTSSTNNDHVFENKKYKFTIKYPTGWDYQQPDLQSVNFSWKSGHDAYYAEVNLQVIPSKLAGGIYSSPHDVVVSLKDDILKDTTQVKFIAGGTASLPYDPARFKGEYFIVTYTYNHEPMKKMQYIFMEQGSNYIYSWGYTAYADHFDNDLPFAKEMFESWSIR